MKKLLMASALGLLSVAVVCAQKRQTDREFDGLKGPVKSVSLESAALKSQEGRQVEERRVMAESMTYDADGNRLGDEWYSPTGSLFVKRVFRPDGAGKVADTYAAAPAIIAPGDTPKEGGGPPKQEPRTMLRSSEKYRYKYDREGNISEWAILSEGRVTRRVVYKRKEGGKELLSYADGKDLDYKRVETLDAKGNVAESTATKIFLVAEDEKDSLTEKHSYTAYEFDARGNWVKRVKSEWTTEGGGPRYVPVQVEYRTIVYF